MAADFKAFRSGCRNFSRCSHVPSHLQNNEYSQASQTKKPIGCPPTDNNLIELHHSKSGKPIHLASQKAQHHTLILLIQSFSPPRIASSFIVALPHLIIQPHKRRQKMTLLGSSSSMFLLLVLSFLATLATAANQVCPLCATAADLPVRWDFRIQDGRTCRDLYLYLGGMSPSNSMW